MPNMYIYNRHIEREGSKGILKTDAISLVDIADTEVDVGVDFLCVNPFLILCTPCCPRLALPSPGQISLFYLWILVKRVNSNMLLKAIITFFFLSQIKIFLYPDILIIQKNCIKFLPTTCRAV